MKRWLGNFSEKDVKKDIEARAYSQVDPEKLM
jgi:hypothetical protein